MNKLTVYLIAVFALFLASCSKQVTTAGFQKTATHAYANYKAEEANDIVKAEVTKEVSETLSASTNEEEIVVPEVTDQMKEEHQAFYDKLASHKEKIEALEVNETMTKKEIHAAQKEIQKEIRQDIKTEMTAAKESEASDDYIIMMILSILIAPVGLGFLYGWGSTEFWIGLVLFFLFWLPGAIYGGIMAHKHFN